MLACGSDLRHGSCYHFRNVAFLADWIWGGEGQSCILCHMPVPIARKVYLAFSDSEEEFATAKDMAHGKLLSDMMKLFIKENNIVTTCTDGMAQDFSEESVAPHRGGKRFFDFLSIQRDLK